MMLRRTLSALSATLLLAGVATSAVAAPAKPAHAKAMHAAPKKMSAKKPAAMHAPRRGGDAQNATVDQLNAQSLQRAQTGAPAQ